MTDEPDSQIDAMAERIRDLELQLQEQTVRLDAAISAIGADEPARPRAGEPGSTATVPVASSTSRRDLFRTGAVAIGAGVVGAAALASPAAGADGGSVLIGNVNSGTSRTDLQLGGSGALGHNVFTAQDAGFNTSSAPAALGGYATGARVGNGVYGYSSSIVATDSKSGYGLVGACENRGTATRSQLYLWPIGPVPASDSVSHLAGEVVVSGDNRLWFCTASGSPGTWEEITGDRSLIADLQSQVTTAQGTADDAATGVADLQSQVAAIAGGPTFLATSQRAFDSRPGNPGDGAAKGAFAARENRIIDLTVDTDFPEGALAAIVHLTVARSTSSYGYLSVYSAAVPDIALPGFSSANWFGSGQVDANTTMTAVSPAGAIKIFAFDTTHVAVDVIGYYA